MTNVLNITDRLKGKKKKEKAKAYRRQIETIHRIVQCTCCNFRCAMCGQHIPEEETGSAFEIHSSGTTLCGGCRAEFESYLGVNQDKDEAEVFWRNEEWVRLWSTWWEFQQAISQFRRSPEYKQLVEEPEW
jgi:hypothetical protein